MKKGNTEEHWGTAAKFSEDACLPMRFNDRDNRDKTYSEITSSIDGKFGEPSSTRGCSSQPVRARRRKASGSRGAHQEFPLGCLEAKLGMLSMFTGYEISHRTVNIELQVGTQVHF